MISKRNVDQTRRRASYYIDKILNGRVIVLWGLFYILTFIDTVLGLLSVYIKLSMFLLVKWIIIVSMRSSGSGFIFAFGILDNNRTEWNHELIILFQAHHMWHSEIFILYKVPTIHAITTLLSFPSLSFYCVGFSYGTESNADEFKQNDQIMCQVFG